MGSACGRQKFLLEPGHKERGVALSGTVACLPAVAYTSGTTSWLVTYGEAERTMADGSADDWCLGKLQ